MALSTKNAVNDHFLRIDIRAFDKAICLIQAALKGKGLIFVIEGVIATYFPDHGGGFRISVSMVIQRTLHFVQGGHGWKAQITKQNRRYDHWPGWSG